MSDIDIHESDPETVATAAHELGHAFGFREGGLTVGLIKINPFWGNPFCRVKEDYFDEKMLHGFLMGLAAGFEAQDRYCKAYDLPPADRANAAYDFGEINRLAPEIGCTEAALCTEARVMLDAIWDELCAMVPELVERGTMHTPDM